MLLAYLEWCVIVYGFSSRSEDNTKPKNAISTNFKHKFIKNMRYRNFTETEKNAVNIFGVLLILMVMTSEYDSES